MKLVAPNFYRGVRSDPKYLREIRAGVVVNLEWGFSNFFGNDAYDNYDFYSHNIEEVRIRMSDFCAPSQAQTLRAVKTIQTAIDTGSVVFLHCMSGVDRTGFVVAAWRMIVQGWTFDEAYDEWVAEGRHFWYDWWKHELKKYEGMEL